MAYTFTTKVAARGYHVYKNTTWIRAKAGDEVKVSIETDKKVEILTPMLVLSNAWLVHLTC